MNKKEKIKQDGKEYDRFEDFVHKIMCVPKEEINERGKNWKAKERKRDSTVFLP